MPYKQFFQQANKPEFWEQHWKNSKIDYDLPEDNIILSTVRTHARKEGFILEAGCGCAQFVNIIEKEGNKIIGLDFDQKTLLKVKERFPHMLLVCGDVKALPFKQMSISTYLSLGVVEHFEEGPDKPLKEAHSILNENGVIICSVPYYNFFRTIMWKFLPPEHNNNAQFYQYFFRKNEFKKILHHIGFKIADTNYYDVRKTIVDLFPKYKKKAIEKIELSRPYQQKTQNNVLSLLIHTLRILSRTRLIKALTAHMILFVAKPKVE